MGEFEIACKKVTGWAEKISGCSKDIKKQEGRVEDILRQMRFHEENYRGMEQALSGVVESLHRQQEQMQQYGNVLENIVRAYESTETGILAKDVQD